MSHTHLRLWVATFWAFILALVCGCTSVAPYRHRFEQLADHHYETSHCKSPKEFKNAPPSEMPPCYSASVERVNEEGNKYALFFVEFDEQGRFYDRRQIDALSAYLKHFKTNASHTPISDKCPNHNDGVSIVTFVHGWRNNARYDNENVQLARKILKFTYLAEQAGTHYNPSDCPREVVGVYVGWRGLSTATNDLPKTEFGSWVGSPWEAISVWDRKNTAQNVAVGSVRELFSMLKSYQDQRNSSAFQGNKDDANDKTPKGDDCRHLPKGAKAEDIYLCKPVRHLIVGHSFGALIINNAISQHLLENITRGMVTDPQTDCEEADPKYGGMPGPSMVRSYADLVILLNPAVEGARYEPLQDASNVRARIEFGKHGAFCANQKPVLVSLTSSGDSANRWGFWSVRLASTIMESSRPQNDAYSDVERNYISDEEALSSRNAMGHIPRYHTHELMGWDTLVKTYSSSPELPKNPLDGDIKAASAFKTYAEAFGDYCKPPADMPHSIDSQLLKLRCMTEEEAEKVLKNEEQDQCSAFLTDIHLAQTLLGRSNLQWPPGGQFQANPIPHWNAPFAGGTVLRHLHDYAPSRGPKLEKAQLYTVHSPASPLWNIYVKDRSIMKGHSEIESDRLLLLLQQIYHATVMKSFKPDVVHAFGENARTRYLEERCLDSLPDAE